MSILPCLSKHFWVEAVITSNLTSMDHSEHPDVIGISQILGELECLRKPKPWYKLNRFQSDTSCAKHWNHIGESEHTFTPFVVAGYMFARINCFWRNKQVYIDSLFEIREVEPSNFIFENIGLNEKY